MSQPLISIIVPVYNVEKYLDECVNSIVNQTYHNLEIILVDDGSPDSSPRMCDEWAARDSRVKVIHKPNGGLSDARNVGIDASTGELLMFVDSDDFVKTDMVESLHTLMAKTRADVACGGVYKFINGKSTPVYNDCIVAETSFSGLEQLKNLLNSKTDVAAWGKLYKKASIGAHRFIKGRYNEDVIFLFGLYQKCECVAYTDKRFYYYRDTQGSITNTISSRTMDALINANEMERIAFERNLPIAAEMRNYKCRTHLEIGYSIQKSGMRQAFRKEAKAAKKQTRNNFPYMLMSPNYNWRDIVHAIINLVRL